MVSWPTQSLFLKRKYPEVFPVGLILTDVGPHLDHVSSPTTQQAFESYGNKKHYKRSC
jgi:hypothetical protein